MRFSIATEIRASPTTVWKVLRDVERWPEWTASMTSLRLLDDGLLAVGSRVRVRQPKLPPAEMRVTELGEERGFEWVARSPGLQTTAGHEIEPLGPGSRVKLWVEFDGLLSPLVSRLIGDLTRRYIRLEAEGLKRRSEEVSSGMAERREVIGS